MSYDQLLVDIENIFTCGNYEEKINENITLFCKKILTINEPDLKVNKGKHYFIF